MTIPHVKLKYLADIRASNVDKKWVDGDVPVRLCNYKDVYKNQEITEDLPFMEATATKAQLAEFGLRSGDVLITKDSESPDDIGVPAYVPKTLESVVCGYHLSVIRPNPLKVDGNFLTWVLQSEPARHFFTGRANGVTRFALGYAELSDVPVPTPGLAEQRAIVRFLDREISIVDALLEKRLLSVQNQRQYFDALSESLIEPTRRKMEPLRHVATQVTVGVVVNPSSYVDPAGQIPFFRGIDVAPFRLDLPGAQRISAASNQTLHKSSLKTGDIVSVRDGDPGTSAVVPPAADGSNCASLLITRRGPRFDSHYLCHVFNSRFGRHEFQRYSYGAAQKHVNVSGAVQISIPMTNLDEQRAIGRRLNDEWERMLALEAKVMEQANRLRSYRSALITAAVTGEMDVGEAA